MGCSISRIQIIQSPSIQKNIIISNKKSDSISKSIKGGEFDKLPHINIKGSEFMKMKTDKKHPLPNDSNRESFYKGVIDTSMYKSCQRLKNKIPEKNKKNEYNLEEILVRPTNTKINLPNRNSSRSSFSRTRLKKSSPSEIRKWSNETFSSSENYNRTNLGSEHDYNEHLTNEIEQNVKNETTKNLERINSLKLLKKETLKEKIRAHHRYGEKIRNMRSLGGGSNFSSISCSSPRSRKSPKMISPKKRPSKRSIGFKLPLLISETQSKSRINFS